MCSPASVCKSKRKVLRGPAYRTYPGPVREGELRFVTLLFGMISSNS
jgi:hypothetical protein